MKKNRFASIFILVYFVIVIILLICSFFNFSLVVGWTYGAFASLLGHLTIKITFGNFGFQKIKSRLLIVIRQLINMLIQGVFLIILIIVNNVTNEFSVFGGSMNEMFYPINLITYLIGFNITWYGILFLWMTKELNDK